MSGVLCPRVREDCPCPALRTRPTALSLGGWEVTTVSTSSTPLPAKGCDLCTTNHDYSYDLYDMPEISIQEILW